MRALEQNSNLTSALIHYGNLLEIKGLEKEAEEFFIRASHHNRRKEVKKEDNNINNNNIIDNTL